MKKRFWSCVISLAAAVGLMTSTAVAETVASLNEGTGISVSIETDSDSYKENEAVNLSVVIKNTSTYTYNGLYYEISLPDGVEFLNTTNATGALSLTAGQTKIVKFVSDGDAVEKPTMVPEDESGLTDTKSDKTGQEGKAGQGVIIGICIVLVIVAVVSVIALIIILKSKKNKKKSKKKKNEADGIIASSLILALVVSSLAAIPAKADVVDLSGLSITTKKTIEVNGEKKDIVVTIKEKDENSATVVSNNIGIHDPSVFYDPVSGEYYSYGSHIIAGNSDDLVSWTYVASSSVGYSSSNQLFSKHYLQEFAEVYEWLGAGVVEGIWALDVTYSEAAAEAGKAPYFMYVTVTDASRAAICLATAEKPEGPFTYQEMIVCSDFRQSELDKVNLLDVLGVDSVDDLTTAQKSYYITASRDAYRAKFPDCIDAAPFYDGEGNMYMAYGSFSSTGGIRVLKMDPLTGLRAEDNYKYDPANLQDPYYGKQIAVKRGEGPYILTVESDLSSTGYYYFLFWSQGVLSATGGYNMRMLRSEYPDRGYVDYAGNSAMESSVVGVRIMDNFWFTGMQYSSTANGGNSAIVTEDGKMFLHYHSKSAHTNAYGENGFIIKSNQMFLNEEGWLVATPYKYYGETMEELDKSQVVGDYEFVYHTLSSFRHPVNFDDNYVESEYISLNEDGTVTGAYTGTWTMDGNYFTIKIGDKEYKGVVLEQFDESANRVKTVVFTAEGKDNRTVWGSKIYYADADRVAKDMTYITLTDNATEDFELPAAGRLNSKITWTSNNGAIVVNGSTADVVRQDADQSVTLTATISFGDASETKDFTVTVPAEEFKIPSTVSTSSISLPTQTESGQKITWTSSDPSIINVDTGVVNVSASSQKVTITGTIEGSDRVITKEITVMPLPTTVKYSENYDSLASMNATVETGLWYSKNAAEAVTLQNDANGGKYVQFAPGAANSRGAISTFAAEGQVSGIYVLDFDVALTAGDNQTTEFAVSTENLSYLNNVINDGIAGGYLFKLSSNNTTTWAVNDGATFDVAKGQWIHVNALVDTDTGTVALTITNGDTELFADTVEINGAGTLKGFYIRGGRYQSVTAVDNVTIKQN